MTINGDHKARKTPRAEPVGSLLRTAEISQYIDSLYADSASAFRTPVQRRQPDRIAELNRLADAAIPNILQRQIDAGMDVINDGEVRRAGFLNSLYDSVEGLRAADERIVDHDDDGNVVGEWMSDPVVAQRLRKVFSTVAEEASYVRALTDYPFKVTLPAPSYFLMELVKVDAPDYGSRLEIAEDVVAIERLLAEEAVAAGAGYVQFDFPIYPALAATSSNTPAGTMVDSMGQTPEAILEHALALDRAVAEGLPDGITTALHICRGNIPGGMWNGSLEPIAEQLFGELPHDRFLIEWDDPSREGDYSPIRFVPPGKTMAMGLVSTKTAELESEDDLVRRLDEASEHLELGQLALSPQCGFASMYADHLVDAEDAQWRKLEQIGKVADRVWGSE